jgi:protein SCO1
LKIVPTPGRADTSATAPEFFALFRFLRLVYRAAHEGRRAMGDADPSRAVAVAGTVARIDSLRKQPAVHSPIPLRPRPAYNPSMSHEPQLHSTPPPSNGPVMGVRGFMWMLAAIALAAALAYLAIYLLHSPPEAKGDPGAGSGAAATDGHLPVLFDAPAFQMTAEDGRTFSSNDLGGKVWVADFFFTTCAGPCPAMSAEMARLSKSVAGADAVRFVSFSVDPGRDTPAVLTEYANKYDADQPRWVLLTEPGTSYLDLAAGFKVMAKPADGSQPIIHSERFFLVDGQGKVRGSYLWKDRESMDRLANDAAELLKQS